MGAWGSDAWNPQPPEAPDPLPRHRWDRHDTLDVLVIALVVIGLIAVGLVSAR